MYTVLLAATPSVTLAEDPLLITGATSVTLIVTACVLNAPDGSLAFTLKLYELFTSKSGLALNVTAPVALLIVNADASVPVSA